MQYVLVFLLTGVITINGLTRWESTNCVGCQPCKADTCGQNDKTCECFLTVEHRLSMTMENERMAVYSKQGKLFRFNDTNAQYPLPDTADILTADGASSRLIIVVNRQFPGPAIYAYEGQTLIIHIRNLMHTDTTTVHWHGQHQKGTPYADGVAFVVQCPILPGQIYTYNFKAAPHGTSFYHAHIGDQRSMGLYGPLIIYKEDRHERTEPPEYIVSLQDWNHDDEPETLYQRMLRGVFDFRTKTTHSPTQSVDGASFSNFHMHSGIINGKGRFYTSSKDHNESPLTVYEVEQNRDYRFRVIGAMTLYPFRVYVQGHREIYVVASDGFDIESIPVESFIIQPGERIDFILKTDESPNEYLLVAKSIESNVPGDQYHVAEAIIRYKETLKITNNLPKAADHTCTSSKQCVVFNCPYLYYPATDYRTCKTFNDAKSIDSSSKISDVIGENVVTKFYNFAFPGRPGDTPASVNGRQFLPPVQPPLIDPKRMTYKCSEKECGKNLICECANTDDLNKNVIYQFVLTNIGVGSGWSHPVHLHGHSFYVLKMGFGRYDANDAKLQEQTNDINCTHEFCNEAFWVNETMVTEGLNFINPVQKDTIVVPTGGYVVIRFKADNPGLWFFHCHIDLHNTNGMGMMLNESYKSYPKKPKDLPSCVEYIQYGNPNGSRQMWQMSLFGSAETCACFVVLLCSMVRDYLSSP